MRTFKARSIYLICILSILLGAFSVFAAEGSVESLLPEGYVKEEVFRPGIGSSIGSVAAAKGDAVIIHDGESTGYQAVKGFSLYKGDTVVTMGDGRIKLNLKDGSVLTLLADTHLKLTESVYDGDKKSRSSFLRLGMGKARFVISKLLNMKHSEVEIETTTMVCGVRGSDFVIIVAPGISEVTTFEDTSLEVLSTVIPDPVPIELSSYQRLTVEAGKIPGEPVGITPEEAEAMKEEFRLAFGEEEEEEGEEVAGDAAGGEAGEGIGVLVPAGELVYPEGAFVPDDLEGLAEMDIFDQLQAFDDFQGIQDELLEMEEIISEQEVIEELPGFPEMPE